MVQTTYANGHDRLERIVQPGLRVPQRPPLRFRTLASWASIISYGDSGEKECIDGGCSHNATYDKGAADLATDMWAVHP